MTRLSRIAPLFVDGVPKVLEDGVLYISEVYGTASHKCACGCGTRVVTPLTPTDWKLVREKDRSISLFPSIGNWDYPCRSHYWIRRNRIDWARAWTDVQIAEGRAYDRLNKAEYYARNPSGVITRLWSWLNSLLE